jgi:NAD(P)-dependent dehydrogenase (short-subunit alcohol dehydrogenase family)
VIAVDICRQIDSVAYPLATPADLARTVSEVETLGRRIVAAEADVRDAAALRAAVASGVARLGSVDIVVANAGIGMMSEEASEEQAFRDQARFARCAYARRPTAGEAVRRFPGRCRRYYGGRADGSMRA